MLARAQSLACINSLAVPGRYDEAEVHLRASYTSLKSPLGAQDGRTRTALAGLIDLCDAWGKPERAAQLQTRLPAAQTQPSDDD